MFEAYLIVGVLGQTVTLPDPFRYVFHDFDACEIHAQIMETVFIENIQPVVEASGSEIFGTRPECRYLSVTRKMK